jgi:hypothetical protein
MKLDLRPAATDLTACARCAAPVTFGESLPAEAGGRICAPCIDRLVEESLLARAAG